MKSKMLVCGALAAALTMSVVFSSGCSTRNEEDMNQVIATVDIRQSSANLEKEGLQKYSSAIESERTILKRDLIAAFYNVGSSLVSGGTVSTYGEAFEMLVDALTGTAVVTQYATLMLISWKDADSSSGFSFEEYMNKSTAIEKYEYLLDGETSENDGIESNRVMLAKYALYSSINSSIDSIEEEVIKGEDETTESTETRTTPSGAGEERTDFLPLDEDGNLNYNVYTGYSGYEIDDSGAYKDDMLEGSTKSTRRKAYAYFITNLRDNFLVTEEDDVKDVLTISYIQEEYISQLQQQVINEYYERYESEQEALIDAVDENGVYTFIKNRYESDYADQTISNSSVSAFESSMSSLSDTSFILYAPATEGTEGGTYGYIYNILLPFSANQNIYIDSTDTSAQYYFNRKSILEDITATDQRSAWFNGATDYAFNAAQSDKITDYYGKDSGREYLFFEENLTNDKRYQTLDKYTGLYSYNGSVSENADGTYSLMPAQLTVDDMLDEFVSYVNYVLGDDTAASWSYDDRYNVTSPDDYYTEETKDLPDSKKEIDYSRFIYATGKVEVGYDETSVSSYLKAMFDKTSDAYKAMSAVNELQYAYTTDTSVLSQYIGYTVSAYDTDYIPEFEYAAQEAVEKGPGTVYVCAGDYGWHIIYVTATFDTAGGAVYGDNIDWTAEYVLKDGTFQNLYYTWIKDSVLTNVSTNRRSVINELFGGSKTVTLYEDTYKDLLELDTQASNS